ncbi:RNA ligase partner protein [Candidatus Nanohalococcus occultus]|uniref:RNA ligase partner protein n=1 Tax=Candidatus Nanohalococcus occultus TaxID=2978047 RepID=UPI0039DFD999
MDKEKFVVDTSAFMTEDARENNESMAEAVERILDTLKRAEQEKGFKFYMPDSTFEELEKIMEGSVSDEVLSKLNTWVRCRSPSRHEVKVPGDMMYKFVEEMRKRVDKGLRDSEKALHKLDEMEEEPEHEYYDQVDVAVSDLRDDYKETMRKGIVDSKEDLDLLLLAKELDATLVSEDRGVLNWADEFGITHLEGNRLADVLEERL